MSYGYTLYSLPVSGLKDPQTIAEMSDRLNSTLIQIDGIRNCPAGLTASLQQAISNIRLHVITALSAIDAYLAVGHIAAEPSLSVPDLQVALDNQITAINQAKPVWDAWYKDAVAQGVSTDWLPAPASSVLLRSSTLQPVVIGDGSDTLATVSSATPSLRDYVAIAGVAAAAWLILKVVK